MAFNPNRLALARRRRAFTKKFLANATGIPTRTYRAYESGENVPPDDKLETLAKCLNFPVAFFLNEKDPVEIDTGGASFRALRSMTARQRDAVLAAGSLAVELDDFLGSRLSLPETNVPDFRDAHPEQAARALREYWGLGERPVANMIHLLESNGVRVFSLDRAHSTVDAFTITYLQRRHIFLNTLKTGERGRFDAAHELGHLVLHQHGVPRGRHLESDANAFASAFLMPSSKIVAIVPRAPTVHRLTELKKPWGVSVGALARRMFDLQVMSEWYYRQIFIELSKRGRANEPEPMPRETSSLLLQAFALLRERGMQTSRVAKELRITMAELNGLVFGLTPVALVGNPRLGNSRSRAKLRAL